MIQNSALSQNWAEVHTQRTLTEHTVRPGRAHYAQATGALRRVVARSVFCCRPSTSRVAGLAGRVTHCIAAPPRMSLFVVSQLLRHVASLSRNTTQRPSCALYRDPQGRPQPQYNLYRDSTWPGHARKQAGRIVALLAMSWPFLTMS